MPAKEGFHLHSIQHMKYFNLQIGLVKTNKKVILLEEEPVSKAVTSTTGILVIFIVRALASATTGPATLL